MAVKTPNSRGEQDEAYNPSQKSVDEKFNRIVSGYTSPAEDLQKLENIANGESPTGVSGADGSPTQNINEAEAREQDAGNAINYTGSGNQGTSAKTPLTIREQLRKRGPFGLLILLLLGGGGALTIFFSPGILIIDLKEKFNEKFNDQLATMDDQSYRLLKKKFKGQGTVVGCTKLSIRCKFNTLSDKQLARLERGGQIKVNTTGDTTLIKGRNKIDSLEFKGKKITADTLIKEANADKEFRAALRSGYNPKLAGFADSVFAKLARKDGIDKQKNLTGTTEQELNDEVSKATSGAAAAEVEAKVTSTEEDCAAGSADCVNGKKTVYKDANGNTISKATYDSQINSTSALKAEIDARKTLSETSGSAVKSSLKGALTSTALGLGAISSACTGYTLIRAVGFAAKYIGMLQLLRYWQVVANTADADKAGDGTTEANTYLGNILTSTNSEGKSATDAYGYKYAAYGDTANMPQSEDIQAQNGGNNGIILKDTEKQKIITNDETTKYINGQLISNNLMSSVIKLTGQTGSTDQIDAGCGFVKSGWGQTIVIGASIAGAAVAFFTGGASLGWGIVAQSAVSVSITVALAMITPKLIDMAAGTMINNHENGNQAGNALTSGAGAMNTQTFMSRGIPVLQKQDAVAYQEKTDKVLAQYAEEDRLAYSPLDPTNRNTFMGSVVSNLIPYATKMSSLTSALPTVMSLTANSIGGLLPQAGAIDSTAQFNVCQDQDYTAQNAAADPFCNLRGGFTDEVMNIDSDTVLDYMISNNYIDADTGEPTNGDNEYAKYLQDCTDRSVPIGGYTEDNSDKGTKCIQGRNGSDEPKLNMFRKMSVLTGVNDGMDNGYDQPTSASSSQSDAATPEFCKTMAANDLGQIACHAYQFDNYGYKWGGGHSGTAQGFMTDFKAGKYIAGKDSILDCSGLVRMSVFDATGVDIGGMGTGSYPTYSKFQPVSKDQAKAGDILWKDNPGHTEVIVSNDPATKTFKTFGAHTSGTAFANQIGPASVSYDYFSKVFRLVT